MSNPVEPYDRNKPFEAIHPFRDGNGRAGRILCILLMIQKQLLDVPILYLSAYIIREKDEYYELLQNVTGLRAWNDWKGRRKVQPI